MASPSELEQLTNQIFPELDREIGKVQEDVIQSRKRLRKVPPALLPPLSKASIDKAVEHLEKATKHLLACRGDLYDHYPSNAAYSAEQGFRNIKAGVVSYG
jgi:hypothetical protein|tara:strand:+ start:310 stop:612 length:303 start_codon:yes stop_codon:yes gene_type:complete